MAADGWGRFLGGLPPAHAVLGMDGQAESSPLMSDRLVPLPVSTTPLDFPTQTRGIREHWDPQAAPAHQGAAVLNTAFVHPRSLCVKFLRGGGSMKTPPWLGCKHPAGLFPVPQELWGPEQKHQPQSTTGGQASKLNSAPGCELPATSLQNPGLDLWAELGKFLVSHRTLHPGRRDQKAPTALCRLGRAPESVIFRDPASM